MKVAVVYNFESQEVINLFGVPNQEKYGLAAIKRITDSLKAGGHQVVALEGDKDLVDKLEEFMPRVVKGERPGMVFNISYGIQGQARYTHVPGILEMVGMPYVGSGPLAHSLALDKVVAKMVFVQRGVPTPEFAVLDDPGFAAPDLRYPLIVKPKNEARSFGLKIVNDEAELREAADVIFKEFEQAVLAERYIEGREINVGLLGNNPPEALPPAEILFGEGPKIYTLEDKTRQSGREIRLGCPADIGPELTEKAQEIARKAFAALGCYDCARVDMRLDDEGNLYVLEINSLPSLGEHGSYVAAAATAGLDFAALVNRLVEVASARYFGTPHPPRLSTKDTSPQEMVFGFLTERRDRLEQKVQEWTAVQSRTSDPVGLRSAMRRLEETHRELGMVAAPRFTDERSVWTWETEKGFRGGTLLVAHADVPLEPGVAVQTFRRDPERLYGEAIGLSRAPLVMLEFALRALRHQRRLRRLPIGVLVYTDEGRDCRYSGELIRQASAEAGQVLMLRAGHPGNHLVNQRRGQRKYRLLVEGATARPGKATKKPEVFRWATGRLEEMAALSSRKERVAIAVTDFATTAYPMAMPHRVTVELVLSYPDATSADRLEARMREILGRGGPTWQLDLISDRPPLNPHPATEELWKVIQGVAQQWDIPLQVESSVLPSAAGLVPESVGVLCALGAVSHDRYTPQESIERISLVQRTLLLAQYLGRDLSR